MENGTEVASKNLEKETRKEAEGNADAHRLHRGPSGRTKLNEPLGKKKSKTSERLGSDNSHGTPSVGKFKINLNDASTRSMQGSLYELSKSGCPSKHNCCDRSIATGAAKKESTKARTRPPGASEESLGKDASKSKVTSRSRNLSSYTKNRTCELREKQSRQCRTESGPREPPKDVKRKRAPSRTPQRRVKPSTANSTLSTDSQSTEILFYEKVSIKDNGEARNGKDSRKQWRLDEGAVMTSLNTLAASTSRSSCSESDSSSVRGSVRPKECTMADSKRRRVTKMERVAYYADRLGYREKKVRGELRRSLVSNHYSLAESGLSKLTDGLLKTILTYLKYEDVGKVRSVCRVFRVLGDSVVTQGFESTLHRLLLGLKRLEIEADITWDLPEMERISAQYHFLYFLLSELRVVQAVCWRYVIKGLSVFLGGVILDEANGLLRRVLENKIVQWKPKDKVADKIFLLITKFLDFFERRIEPDLHHGRIGAKVIDILDSSLISSHDVNVNYDSRNFLLSGQYTLWNLKMLIRPLITVSKDGTSATASPLQLSRFLRQLVRWNNMLYLIDKHIRNHHSVKAGRNMDICGFRMPSKCYVMQERPEENHCCREYLSKKVCKCLIAEQDLKHQSLKCQVVLNCSIRDAPIRFTAEPNFGDFHPAHSCGDESKGKSRKRVIVVSKKILNASYRFKLGLKMELRHHKKVETFSTKGSNTSTESKPTKNYKTNSKRNILQKAVDSLSFIKKFKAKVTGGG